jgi:DNA-binding response OmpR family regulator
VALDRVLGKVDGLLPAADSMPPVTTLRSGDRVLVVEDDALIGAQVAEMLSEADVEAQPVTSIAASKEAIDERSFAAAILDVNVSGEMVFPIARLLEEKGIPFLFLTGYDTVEMWPPDLRHARRLTKPVNALQLYKALGISHRPEASEPISPNLIRVA